VKPSQRPRIAARGGIVLIALMFILAACSSNTGSSPSATTAATAGGSESTAPSSAPPEKATVTIGFSQPIFSFTPLYVGVAKNMWADENLEVKTTVFNSGTDNQQALLGDVITLGAGGYTEPINLTAQGVPTVIFATLQGARP
jgi:ABC-type nitrate/sulfonate/bicarbonate transport system substrate-binding protein